MSHPKARHVREYPRVHKHLGFPDLEHRCDVEVETGRKKSECKRVLREHSGIDMTGKSIYFWFAGCCYKYTSPLTGKDGPKKRQSFNAHLALAKNRPDKLMRIAHQIILETEERLQKVQEEQKVTAKDLYASKQRLRGSKSRYVEFYNTIQARTYNSTRSAKNALIVLFKYVIADTVFIRGEIVRLLGYPARLGKPSPDKCKPGESDFACFNRLIEQVFKRKYPESDGKAIDITQKLCKCEGCKIAATREDKIGPCGSKAHTITLLASQNLVRTMITPDSPYKGLILWHSVGAGKTLAALKVMEDFALRASHASDYNFYWATGTGLKGDVKKEFSKIACETVRTKGVHRFFPLSYRQLGGQLTRKNLAGQFRAKLSAETREGRHIDPLFRSVLVIDEAQLCFDYNHTEMAYTSFPQGLGPNAWTMQHVMDAIHHSHRVSGDNSVRVMLLTATPVTYDPNVFLQLLNMVTETPLLEMGAFSALKHNLHVYKRKKGGAKKDNIDWQKGDAGKQAKKTLGPEQWNVIRSAAFKNAVRGLISYNVLDEDIRRFASKHLITKQVPASALVMERLQDCIKKKTNTARSTCVAKAGSTGLGSHAGSTDKRKGGYNVVRLESKSARAPKTRTTDKAQLRAQLCKQSPKLLELLENIQRLDAADQKTHKRTFKHMIFSRIGNNLGAPLIAGGLKHYLALTMRYPVVKGGGSFQLVSDGALNDYNNFAVLTTAPMGKGQKRLSDSRLPELKNYIKQQFNCRAGEKDNANGKHIRILVLSEQFKEGIDVYDVKYVHIYEPQLTAAATTQAVGRAFRYCGQACLDYKTGPNEYGWVVKVFTYETKLPKLPASDMYSVLAKAAFEELCGQCGRACNTAILKEQAKSLGIRLSVEGKRKNKAHLCAEVNAHMAGKPLAAEAAVVVPQLDVSAPPKTEEECKRYTVNQLKTLDAYKALPGKKPMRKGDICDALVNREAYAKRAAETREAQRQKEEQARIAKYRRLQKEMGTRSLSTYQKMLERKLDTDDIDKMLAVMKTYRVDGFLLDIGSELAKRGVMKRGKQIDTLAPCDKPILPVTAAKSVVEKKPKVITEKAKRTSPAVVRERELECTIL